MVAGFITFALGEWLISRAPAELWIDDALRAGLDTSRGPGIALGLFAVLSVLYLVLPSTRPPLRYALAGALFAAVAWTAITRGFGLYLAYLGQFSGTYGPFAAAIVLMVWMYAVGTVLLVGGEISALPTRPRSPRSS